MGGEMSQEYKQILHLRRKFKSGRYFPARKVRLIISEFLKAIDFYHLKRYNIVCPE